MTGTNSVDDLIAQAEQRSQEVQSETSDAQLPSTQSNTNVPARRPSLDNLLQSGLTVEAWLKVSEDGLKFVVDNKSALFETLKVTIDMNEVIATEAIKWGNPPQYYKTYDGLICADGQTRWSDALDMGARNGTTPYASADIPMTLDEDVVGKAGAGVLLEAGQRIGYSLSTTNRDAYASFQRAINDQNLRHSIVEVELGYEARKNKKGNTWGIVTFKLIGPVTTEAVA